MIKNTVILLATTLGLAANAGYSNSVQSSLNSESAQGSLNSESLNGSLDNVSTSFDSFNGSLDKVSGFSTNGDDLLTSFNTSAGWSADTASTSGKAIWKWTSNAFDLIFVDSGVKVSKYTTVQSGVASAAIFGSEYGSDDISDNTSNVFKKVSAVLLGSTLINKSVNDGTRSGSNVYDEYSGASVDGSSYVKELGKDSIAFSLNGVAKSATAVIAGSALTWTWSQTDLSKAPIKASNELSTFVWEGLSNTVGSIPEKLKSATVSIFRTSTDTFGSKNDVSGLKTSGAKTGSLWLVVSTAGTASKQSGATSSDNLSDVGDVSEASEVLLMLPLNFSTGFSGLSMGKSNDDLKELPNPKKP